MARNNLHGSRRVTLTLSMLIAGIMGTTCHAQESPKVEYAIVIHGGAGRVPESPDWRAGREATLKQSLEAGTKILASGGSSLDAVEAAIRILEDSPYFNAGHGAVFNAAGGIELDASIMDGRTHAGGGVGGVRTVRNPISLARRVMTDTRHVLLISDGAETFADEFQDDAQIERVPNSYFATEEQRQRLERAQEQERRPPAPPGSGGTVGCVAIDKDGNIAAGTSTGGLVNKRFGRIGDSPLLSAGTYADNRTCGVSCTGIGEDFIRYAVAYDVSARMRYLKQPLDDAVRAVLHDPEQTVRGGIIAIDREGRISMQFNTPGMSRAAADSTGYQEIRVAE